METLNWFEYSHESTDIYNAFRLLEFLPDKFKMFVDPQYSTFKNHINAFEDFGVNSELFDKALTLAMEEHKIGFQRKYRLMNLKNNDDPNPELEKIQRKLKKHGLTGDSLKLKANTLNLLWHNVIEKIGKGLIDFANNDIVKLLRKFFAYLNSILGSYAQVFSGLGAIIEIKENIEAYLNIATKD